MTPAWPVQEPGAPRAGGRGAADRPATSASVVVVHGRRLVADVVSRIVDASDGFSTVATAAGAEEARHAVRAHRPDLVVVDDALPGVDVPALVVDLRSVLPSTSVVVLTGAPTGRAVVEARRAGAGAVVHTARPCADLVAALRAVAAGGTWFAGDGIDDPPRLEDLVVHYQPVVDLEGSGVVEVEALVRWDHPVVGLRGPADFLPQAEQTGLVEALGWRVLADACRQAAGWRCSLPEAEGLSVAVNVSLQQLAAPDVVDRVQEALDGAALASHALVLELRETALAAADEHVVRRLHAVAALGVQLRVDDFGTGQSSLVHLRRLPIGALKIDYEFVNAMLARPDAADIVGAIVALAHGLGMRSVAEGVEDDREASLLRALGCELGQGYVWSRPLAADGFEAWYREHLCSLHRTGGPARRDDGAQGGDARATLKYEHCGWCHLRGAYLVPGRPILRCKYCQACLDVSGLPPRRLAEHLDVYARTLRGRRTAEHPSKARACPECGVVPPRD